MKLVGVNNATVSVVEDTYYISVNAVETGTKNSIAFYEEDGHTISSSDAICLEGNAVLIDSETLKLTGVLNLSGIELGDTDYLTPGDVKLKQLTVTDLIEIKGLFAVTGPHALFKAPIIATNNVNIKSKLNIIPRTIISSKGSEKDFLGDVAIDSKYIYYCTKNFDGISNIWVRWKIADSEW